MAASKSDHPADVSLDCDAYDVKNPTRRAGAVPEVSGVPVSMP
jgi:hypothetical protein